jgi:hypothetical protein
MSSAAVGVVTLTVVDALAEPPAPVHVRLNVVAAEIAFVCWLPFVALVPDQPPVAEHVVAFVLVHVSVDGLPLVTGVGFAVSVTVGGVTAATDTVTDRLTVPPLPAHVRTNVLPERSALVFCDPVSGVLPLHAPEAVHVVALMAFQERLADPPLATLVGVAVNDSVGAGATVTVTDRVMLPPAPVQANV